MTKKTRESKPIGIRLPVVWIDIIEKIAEEEERSVNSVIRVAVKEFIQRRKKGGAS